MKNRLIHGDCFEVLPSLPDNSVDAVITDPPYGYLKHRLDAYFDHEVLFPILYRVLKKDALLTFFGRGELLARWVVTCCDLGFKFKEEIVWDKVQMTTPFTSVGRIHELIFLLSKGKRKVNKIKVDAVEQWQYHNIKAIQNTINTLVTTINKLETSDDLKVFKQGDFNITPRKVKHNLTSRESKSKDRGYCSYCTLRDGLRMPSIYRYHREHYNYQHPTQKPLEVMKRLVGLTTNEGDVILNPFGGSGTTAIACLELGRNYICIEKDEEYFEIANKRISDWHNQAKDRKPDHELPDDVDRQVTEGDGQLKLF